MAWITRGDPAKQPQQEIINRFTFRVTGPVDTCPDWVPTINGPNEGREFTIDAGGMITIDLLTPDLTNGC